jgi:hypothetical protein
MQKETKIETETSEKVSLIVEIINRPVGCNELSHRLRGTIARHLSYDKLQQVALLVRAHCRGAVAAVVSV